VCVVLLRLKINNTSLYNVTVYFSGWLIFVASTLELKYSASNGVLADKIYEAHQEPSLTQNEAAAFCRERGGRLATVMDRSEQRHIETELRSSVEHYWIELTFDFMPRLTWLDGSEFSGTLLLSRAQTVHVNSVLTGSNLHEKQSSLID